MNPDNTVWSERRESSCPQTGLPSESTISAEDCRPPSGARPGRDPGAHSPSGLRQKSVEAEPCSLWMVHRYMPQSTGDACTMAKAAGPSSPALQRVETLPVRAITTAQPGPEGGPGAPQTQRSGCWEPWGRQQGTVVKITQVWFAVLTLTSCDSIPLSLYFPPLYYENAGISLVQLL